MDVLSQLQSHPLFATFFPEMLTEVARVGTAVTYQPGEVCVRQGEAGEVFGVLISGRLEAVRGHGTPERRPLGTIRPGECFGEMSLLTGNPSSADVVAVERSEAVVFLQEQISPFIALNREAVRFVTRLMASRLAPPEGGGVLARPAMVRYSLGSSRPMKMLTVSCRRSDMRYSYFDTTSEKAVASGGVVGIGGRKAVHTYSGPRGTWQGIIGSASHETALVAMTGMLTSHDGGVLAEPSELSAVGHRVCHGGLAFDGPTVVDEAVKKEVRRLIPFAPMENPYNLKGIETCQRLLPGVPQVAVFDSAFYLAMPPAAYTYALPKGLAGRQDLRRYGSHGVSHDGAVRAACGLLGVQPDTQKIISCHLGSGASVTAIDHGRCMDTSMGFSPLAGLVMSTRPGDIDPGLLLYLLQEEPMAPAELQDKLYNESGLLGLSGISGDVLTMLASADDGDPQALLAIQVFCHSARKYVGSCLGLLGGVDVICFTGGVGQNAPGLRARICQGLEWTGILLDEARNRSARVGAGEAAVVSHVNSRAHVLAVGGNEDHTIACQTVRAVSQRTVTDIMRQHHKPIPVGISAHHVHLSQEHVEALFGAGHTLTWHGDLSQPGQFACKEQVSVIGPKGRIDRVRVLGPVRRETQVEISRTEEYKLGIDAPVRMSGDLNGTPGVTLEGPAGKVVLDKGAICARRHVHMSPEDAMEFAVRDRDVVRIRVPGERSLVFGDVVVRVRPDFRLDMHLDTDEGNAAELGPNAAGYLDAIQERRSS